MIPYQAPKMHIYFCFLSAVSSILVSKHTVNSIRMTVFTDLFSIIMSGMFDVTTMSAGSVEISCLLLCPDKSEKMTHSIHIVIYIFYSH